MVETAYEDICFSTRQLFDHTRMNINYLLVIISFVIGIFLINYLRSFDLHEKEPMIKMLVVTLWGGIWSIGISLILYEMVLNLGISIYDNIVGALFIIAPVEELAKFLALLSAYILIKNEIDEPTDGLIYMACVAMGFSLIENYFYATDAPYSGFLLFLRLSLSTPIHIFSSIFMGLAFYVIVKFKRGIQLFFIAYAYAILVHGLWNSVIFHSWLLLFLIVILERSKDEALLLLSYTTAISPFRPTLSQFIGDLNGSGFETGLECIKCGNKEKKATFRYKKMLVQKCDACNNYLTTVDSLYYIFHHFGSDFRDLSGYYQHIKNKKYATLFEGNYVSNTKRIAFFRMAAMERALEHFNKRLIQEVEGRWWFYKGLSLH